MKAFQFVHKSLVVGACCGSLLFGQMTTAQQPTDTDRNKIVNTVSPQSFDQVAILDVSLQPDGTLNGLVTDGQGVPKSGASVVVFQGKTSIVRVTSRADGQFDVGGLRGGVYRIASGEGSGLFRIWTADAAPPLARKGVLIVTDSNIVRGQMYIGEIFSSEVFVLSAVVIGAIAIPIAVHNNKRDPAPGS